MRTIMLRHTKEVVNLPPRTVQLVKLGFSQAEHQKYQVKITIGKSFLSLETPLHLYKFSVLSRKNINNQYKQKKCSEG